VDRFANQFRRNDHGRSDQSRGLLPRASQIARGFALIFSCAAWVSPAAERIELKSGDIVAFVGGADVAAAQHTGHLETLLTIAHLGVRFRNFGWEGDTVFAQPREINFPPLVEHLRRAKASVIFVQFGRTEVFTEQAFKAFRPAYEAMLKDFSSVTPRLVLVTPVPFEKAAEPLPDLSQRNADLEKIAAIIREVAREQKLPGVDLFKALSGQKQRLTEDGLQVMPEAHAWVANAFAVELGFSELAWPNPKYEELRKMIVVKNRFWFDYWRPQNWAFLGGDRVQQPSSRDHRDPKVRWFPAEMEKFQILIAQQESEIGKTVEKLNEK
jgi:hypothetical protein